MLCQYQVLGAATSVAKHTSALCNACKAASAKTNNPAAKRQFVQAAKDVANNTANLVKNIKVCIHHHHHHHHLYLNTVSQSFACTRKKKGLPLSHGN